jgi:hypothetical protein
VKGNPYPHDYPTLHILDTSTGQIRDLGIDVYHFYPWVRWSPTGEWIAFNNGNHYLSIIRPDGSGLRELLTAADHRPGYEGQHAEASAGFDWSRDGKWIIASTGNVYYGDSRIELIQVESGVAVRLLHTQGKGYSNPIWKPN